MVAKREGRSERALIEVWREGDRVLIGVPSAEGWTRSDIDPGVFNEPHLDHPIVIGEELSIEDLFNSVFGLECTEPKRSASNLTDAEQVAVEMFAMSEDEWLAADLLALRRQAVDLSHSVDETLAYVAEKCAAIGKD